MHENRSRARTKHNQRPKSAGLSLTFPRNPLLDHAATEIRGNQTFVCIQDRSTQRSVGIPAFLRNAGVISF